MRRNAFCALCAALLLLGGLPARAETACFTWDLDDWERTHVSCGTGGTERRVWSDALKKLDDPALIAMMNEWNGQAARALGIAKPALDDWVLWPENDALQNLSLRTCDEEENTFQLRSAVLDLQRKRWLKLSDLFYAGFNYTDYINTYIAHMPADTSAHNDLGMISPTEEWGTRAPFTGLPNDYPYFAVRTRYLDGTYLEILFDGENPFWIEWPNVNYWPTGVLVPLSHWISPWGRCTAAARYAQEPLPDGILFPIPILRVDDGRVPEAEAKINEKLAEVARRHMGEQEKWKPDQAYWVECSLRLNGAYASVSFDVMVEGGDWGEYSICTLSDTLLNLHTGETADAQTLFDAWKDSPEASWWIAEAESEEVPDYVPPEKVEYLSIARYADHVCIGFYDEEQGANEMRLPLSALGWRSEEPQHLAQ